MYLPNTVRKRHKKAFKFIFGYRNLRLRDSAFVRCAPQHMVTEMTTFASCQNAARSNKVLFLCWVDYPLEGSTGNVILAGILAACFTLRGHYTYRFTVVIVSGRQDLPSDASAFSLTSIEG